MNETERNQPDYDNPPVIETVMGLSFLPMPHWSILHYGLYWNEIRAEYPNSEVQPPMPTVFENFGDGEATGQEMFLGPMFGPSAPARCWFIDQSGTRLIQVQQDRFIFNWRKTSPTDKYPRYAVLREEFRREWARFRAFLVKAEIPIPAVRQWEWTYINHLDRGKEWQTFDDLADVIRCWSCDTGQGNKLPSPEAVSISTRYLLPDQKGRLNIDAQPATKLDGQDVIQIYVRARGLPSSQDEDELLRCIDRGHDWALTGFDSITTDKMHTLWGRRAPR